MFAGCTTKDELSNVSYIKILTEGLADSPTIYNKGFGLHNYLYYDPQKDSAVLRFIHSTDPWEHETYIGNFENKRFRDTLFSLIKLLRSFKPGHVSPDSMPPGATYCGAQFYVEFEDKKGITNYSFIVDRDALFEFDRFFHRLTELHWKRQLVSNSIIQAEEEMINAAKKTGLYDSTLIPFLPPPCLSTIDFSKITGVWRDTGYRTTYYKTIVLENGKFKNEKITSGKLTKTYPGGTLSVNRKDTTVTFKTNNTQKTFKLISLNDICFEYQFSFDGQRRRLYRE
jgi:hypothetical protein